MQQLLWNHKAASYEEQDAPVFQLGQMQSLYAPHPHSHRALG